MEGTSAAANAVATAPVCRGRGKMRGEKQKGCETGMPEWMLGRQGGEKPMRLRSQGNESTEGEVIWKFGRQREKRGKER